MKKPLLLFAIGAVVFMSCKSDQINNVPPVIELEDISFATEIQPIFNASCAPCHTTNTTSGVNLSSYDATVNSIGVRYGTEVVAPGNADNSPLVDKLFDNPDFGARMPLGRGPLSGEDIGLIITWINEGAQNN